MIRYFVVWRNKINARLSTLTRTIGISRLTTCLFVSLMVAKLSGTVLRKEAYLFDQYFLLWLRPWANPILDQGMLTITQLGDFNIVIIVITITLSVLFWKSYYQEAKIYLLACFGFVILADGMKLLFAKPRPQFWTHLVEAGSFSFPSGHAVGSVIIYGFIGFLLSYHYPKFSQLIYCFITILILLIGFSRLYLGVHWPTDIIAGYGIGFLWLTCCVTLLKLQKSSRIK